MIIHNPETEMEHYSQMLRKKTKDSSPMLRSSFRRAGIENTIMYYFLDRFEVINININYHILS